MEASTRIETLRARLRDAHGLSLVEMLIVLGIIGIISAVLVPFAINAGWFTSSKSSFAAREYFTLLKAASVYAGTYNVETALAYGGRIVVDSEANPPADVPVVDYFILARKLKREEVIELLESGHGALTSPDEDYYAAVAGPEGIFRPLPNQTCLLPDTFSVELENQNGNPVWVSSKGLRGIRVYDPQDQAFVLPIFQNGFVLDYALDSYVYDENDPTEPASFPAHVFKPDGSLRVSTNFAQQRFRVRAGVMPDQEYSERFHTDEEFITVPDPSEWPYIVFDTFDPLAPPPPRIPVFYSSDPVDLAADVNTFADIDVSIEFFVATGRVKVIP